MNQVALARQNVFLFNKAEAIHAPSCPVFLPKAQSQSRALRRRDGRGALIKRPDILDVYDDETLRPLFPFFVVTLSPCHSSRRAATNTGSRRPFVPNATRDLRPKDGSAGRPAACLFMPNARLIRP
ncbi:Uncharacterized protein DBV15_00889 [Temnothorax longispinosus]|uniref:Uncharacterized protein n=1 Tax=Temnothorax longispinosus TaxID=300112 RepID=A0A4S2JEH2_9HYME|nr:Uncharacterized protein DBV15_00889 [Temnothorax longispinosus]